jgi:TetR/AcrR family transcriptional regulator
MRAMSTPIAHRGVTNPPPLPPPSGPLRGADLTGERLLRAAHELLYERVGEAVSQSELCARAGANVAMVKYCFGSKDGLYDALVERVVTALVADLERPDAEHLEPAEKLRLHIRAVVRNYVRYPYLNHLINKRFLSGNVEAVQRLSETFAVPTREWYAQLLAEGHEAGQFRRLDPTLFFFSLLGVCELIFSARPWLEHAFGEEIDEQLLERFIEHTTALIFEGIEPR